MFPEFTLLYVLRKGIIIDFGAKTIDTCEKFVFTKICKVSFEDLGFRRTLKRIR